MRHGRNPFIVGFLAAPVVLYVFFVILPYVEAFYYSFTNWRGFQKAEWVGLDNYKKMLDDDTFWKAVSHNGIILLLLPLAALVIALFFAFLLNVGGKAKAGVSQGVRGSKFYRLVFFFPQLLAVPIVAVLFQSVYRPDKSGVLNGILGWFGIEPVGWLIEPKIALLMLIAVMVWQAIGFYVVLFSAGMSSIPAEIYEAAELDGSSPATTFRRITLPLLWGNIQTAWVYLGVAAFDAFAIVDVLSNNQGGPDFSTTVLSEEIYKATSAGKYGYATTLGVALFFLTATFAVIAFTSTKRESVEY